MMRDMVQVRRGGGHSYESPDVSFGRSQFNRRHTRKMSFDASYLYPILVDEVYPGDTHTLRMHGFARIFSPLDAPIMDNIELESFFFFVPYRLVWDNWVYFQGEHDAAGAQDTDFTIPQLASGVTVDHDNSGYACENLAAYFGIPHGLQTGSVGINSLPFRAYNLIYNEWFRPQDTQDEVTKQTGNGPDTTASYQIRQSMKKHDYFTSALPYLQKGDVQAVSIGTSAPVRSPGNVGDNPVIGVDGDSTWRLLDSGAAQVDISATSGNSANALYADLSSATGVSINALRQSLAIQRLLERDGRSGTRYVEAIKGRWGVTSPDYRLQRPEYLGGGKSFINVSPVANMSATATEDQGELRGIGTGVLNNHGFQKSFTEHGVIIGLMRARGDITYFQGLDRYWSRQTRYDLYEPALANLGEMSVLNKEIFVSNSAGTDDTAWAYQEQWADLRQKKSEVIGLFNPDVSGNLGHWHLAEDHPSLPSFNTAFLKDNTPMSRVTTVDTENDFIADLAFDYRSARVMPVRSIPSITQARF